MHLAPAEEALENISQKILAYQEEQQERPAKRKRHALRLQPSSLPTPNHYAARKPATSEALELKQVFAELLVKLIRTTLKSSWYFTKSINELLTRKDELTTAERRSWEVAKFDSTANANRKSLKLS